MTDTYKYSRKPSEYEIKFGECATHYIDFPLCFCCDDEGKPKQWVIDPHTKIRCTLVK